MQKSSAGLMFVCVLQQMRRSIVTPPEMVLHLWGKSGNLFAAVVGRA
jgi:hypothetical protein